jgi:hypothetical protein
MTFRFVTTIDEVLDLVLTAPASARPPAEHEAPAPAVP